MSNIEIAREAFERIKAANPKLQMEIENSPESQFLDLAMYINTQSGLGFDIHLDLQNNDELSLQLESFCCEWFPCTESVGVSEYVAAVNGLLSGEYRLKVITRRGSPVKSYLQAPIKSKWSTIATWSKLHLPIGNKTISYVQNNTNT